MASRKAALSLLCAGLLAQAGAARAEGPSPPPVARPESSAGQSQKEAPPKGPASNLGQTLNPPDINPQDLSTTERAARKTYQALIKKEAGKNGLPPDIADAVAAIESGYDPAAVGGAGEIGLMQVRPETAAMLGFKGGLTELAKPEVNIHYGVTYLSQAWRLADGDLCRALMKYRAGHGEETMSALSATYCGRARAHLAAAGSPFAAAIPVPYVYEPALPRPHAARRGPRLRTAAVSRAFWAAEEKRVRAITQHIEAKWRRMASR